MKKTILLLCFCQLALAAGFSQTLDAALQAYWDFDNARSIAGDSLFEGMLSGGAERTGKGKKGPGLLLRSESSAFALNRGFNLFDNFTLAFWMKPSRSQESCVIFSQLNSSNGRFFRLSFEGDYLLFECSDEYQSAYNRLGSNKMSFDATEFYLITVSLKNAKLTMTCNTQTIGFADNFELNIRSSQTHDKAFLGSPDSYHKSFQGILDEFMVFDRALSPEEINLLYRLKGPEREKVVTPPAINSIPPIKGRESQLVSPPLEIDTDSILVEYYDRDKEDGDTISIYLNGMPIIEKQPVSKIRKSVSVILSPDQENFITVFAENLGRVPPNTAAVCIYYGKQKKEFNITSDFFSSGTIQFQVGNTTKKPPTPSGRQ